MIIILANIQTQELLRKSSKNGDDVSILIGNPELPEIFTFFFLHSSIFHGIICGTFWGPFAVLYSTHDSLF